MDIKKIIFKMNFDQLREQLKANGVDAGSVDLFSTVLCDKAFIGKLDCSDDGTVFCSIQWDAEAVASALSAFQQKT